MGALIRKRDWAGTPLGPSKAWPEALRTAVQLCVNTPIVSAVYWGSDLHVLYNDAYAPVLSERHPWALGRPLREVWAEISDVLGPQLASVLKTGRGFSTELQPLRLQSNGRLQDTYWAYSFAPVHDDRGAVAGVFVTAFDATDKVDAERRLTVKQERQRRMLRQMPGFAAMLSGPDLVYTYVNDAYVSISERTDFIGRPFRDVFADIEGQGFFEAFERAFRTGAGVVMRGMEFRLHGRTDAQYLDFALEPIRDETGAVTGLFVGGYETTEFYRANAALRRSEEQQRFLLDLGDTVRRLGDPMEIVAVTARALGERLKASRVVYADIDEANDTASAAGGWTDATMLHLPERLRVSDYGALLLDPLRAGLTLRVDDVRQHGSTDKSLAALDAIGVRALVSVPLVKDGRFIANLNVHQSHPRAWTDDEVALIETVAERTWDSLERAGAEAALRASEARLTFLDQLSAQTAPLASADAVLAATTRLLGEHLNLSVCAYADMDEDEDGFTIRGDWAAPGAKSIVGRYSLAAFGKLAVERLTAGLPLVVNDNLVELAPDEAATFQNIGIAATVCMPLVKEGRLIALMAIHDRAPRAWTEAELSLLREVTARSWAHVERVAAVAALRDSEERLRLAVDNAEIGFWDVDVRQDALIWPARTKAMFGISPDAPVTMQDFYDGLHPDDREATSAAYAAAADPARRALYDVEYRTLGKEDGILRWVAAKGRGLFDEAGRCLRVAGTAIDVTQRKQAEQRRLALVALSDAIRAAETPEDLAFAASEILGRTLDVSRVGYGAIDHEAETVRFDRDWTAPGFQSRAGVLQLRSFGSLVDSLKRGEFISIADVRLDGRTVAAADALERSGARSLINVSVVERDRLRAVLYVNYAQARGWTEDEHALIKEVAGRTGTAMERLRAEAELRESEARLRELNETLEHRVAETLAERRLLADVIDGTDILVQVADRNFNWLAVNQSAAAEFARIFGVPRPRVGDNMLEALKHRPGDRAKVEAVWSRALAGEEFVVVDTFGDYAPAGRQYEMRFRTLRDAKGEAIGAYQFVSDVTDRLQEQSRLREAEEALRQSQKMEAIGSLTGGVAHDFNNLLTPIVGSLDMLQRGKVGGEREQRLISAALQSADKAKTLVQRLLAFARRQPLQATAVNVAKMVTGMADLIASTAGPQIRVVVEVAEDLPPAQADLNQLEMALLNLGVNARDAMPDGGTLRISATAERVQGGRRARVKDGDYIRLSVADTGLGMDEATLARAVEPFFSTKGVGKGTGLGLSMVHGLAQQLGGDLTIQSRKGVGTNVELWLPRSTAGTEQAEAASEVSAPNAPLGTALLVDDEALVRMSTADMLTEMGYSVVESACAEDALRLVDDGFKPALLVTDHLMPGMNGAELAQLLRRRWPKLQVLVVSGYAETDGLPSDLPRLTKPFRNAELAASLAALAAPDLP